MVDQSSSVTSTSEQQAVPVAQEADCVRLEDVTSAVAAAFANDACLIWSGEHGLYWRADAAGYTNQRDEAGRYTIGTAYAKTRHCDPDKRIEFHRLAATSLHDMQITPALPHPCKSGEGAGQSDLVNELRAVARAMELVDFHAREPDLDLKPSTCRAIVKDAIAALTPDATQTREAEVRERITQAILQQSTEGENWRGELFDNIIAALNARGGA